MVDILAMASVIAPVTSGAVEVLKRTFGPNENYIPIAAIAVGILLGAAAYFIDAEIGMRMWAGGVSGLAATGLFELGKNVKDEVDK